MTKKKTATRKKRTTKKRTPKRSSAPKAPPVIELERRATIAGVSELKVQLADALIADSTVSVKADGVELVDSAVLQLFTAFANKLKTMGSSLRWQEPSAELLEAARLLGLIVPLGLEEGADEEDDDDLLPVF